MISILLVIATVLTAIARKVIIFDIGTVTPPILPLTSPRKISPAHRIPRPKAKTPDTVRVHAAGGGTHCHDMADTATLARQAPSSRFHLIGKDTPMYLRVTITVSMLVLMFGLWLSPVLAAAGTRLSDTDAQAIRTASADWVAAAQSRDWHALGTIYAEDAVYLPEHGAMRQGRAAIKADFAAFPETPDLTVSVLEIDGRGDLAFARGSVSFNMVPEAGAKPVAVTGKYIEIRKKQADGQWRIIRDIWNTDGKAADRM